jgi:glycosyltransferase involved in cell wall biosynthesis
MTEKVFKVSVIIPVYNAEKYLHKAVDSAIKLQTVGEVILVEDGSSDNSLKVCEDLNQKFDKIRLFRHPKGENRGAGASRNLGIKNALFNYIAFLDADDYYLPNRFEIENEIFPASDTIDGIYHATGVEFYTDKGMEEFSGHFKEYSGGENFLTTIHKIVTEKDQFRKAYIQGKIGRFHTDAITLKKDILKKTAFFDEELRLHQDSHLWTRVVLLCNLHPGIIDKPVAIRGVHDSNRILNERNLESRIKYFSSLLIWIANKPVKREFKRHYLREFIRIQSTNSRIIPIKIFSYFLFSIITFFRFPVIFIRCI